MGIVRCTFDKCTRKPKCIIAYTAAIEPGQIGIEDINIIGEILPERKILKSCPLKVLFMNLIPAD